MGLVPLVLAASILWDSDTETPRMRAKGPVYGGSRSELQVGGSLAGCGWWVRTLVA